MTPPVFFLLHNWIISIRKSSFFLVYGLEVTPLVSRVNRAVSQNFFRTLWCCWKFLHLRGRAVPWGINGVDYFCRVWFALVGDSFPVDVIPTVTMRRARTEVGAPPHQIPPGRHGNPFVCRVHSAPRPPLESPLNESCACVSTFLPPGWIGFHRVILILGLIEFYEVALGLTGFYLWLYRVF